MAVSYLTWIVLSGPSEFRCGMPPQNFPERAETDIFCWRSDMPLSPAFFGFLRLPIEP